MENILTALSRVKRMGLKMIFKVYDLAMDSDKYIRYSHFINGFDNPNYRFNKNQIAFIHLPKTGGTSLSKILGESKDPRFINLNIHKPVSNECSPEDYKYITVMRNPIDRVWSQFQMALRAEKGNPYQKFAQKGLSVYLEKYWAMKNIYCRYLSSEVTKEPNENTLDKAYKNLSNFYRVISFDNFSDEVTTFLEENEVSFSKIPNERKSSYIGPTEEEVLLIRKYNEFDISLFEKWYNKDLK